MLSLLSAIQSNFNASGALTAIFPNGAYVSLAPNKAALPVCVLTVVSTAPQYQTGGSGSDSLNVITIQFSAYSNAEPVGGEVVALTALEAIKTAFDFTTLTISGGQSVLVKRGAEGVIREDEQTVHAFVTYEFWVGEPLP